jgi:hypothetical protein
MQQDDQEWAVFKCRLPYQIYQELHATIDMALRLGASGLPEALSVICGEFRATWEAAEAQLRPKGAYSVFIREAFERDDWVCQLRGSHCTGHHNLTAHHIVPLSHGGELLDINNVATVCNNCHQSITNGLREENWKAVRPILLEKISANWANKETTNPKWAEQTRRVVQSCVVQRNAERSNLPSDKAVGSDPG